MTLSPGTRLGRYEVIRLLGAGGMGEVYLAKDERLEREVALKVLPTGTLADEPARRRFRKEALALSKLNHPNIETVYDFDTQDGMDFLVMEHIPGETLDAKLAAGALPEKEVVSLGTQLVEGLSAAHAQGVVHRDLKPGNLRVTPDGRLKILDFGLAKLLQPVSEGSQVDTLSHTQSTAGTMPYMAPEQLRGEKIDTRSDIFALGAVLYEMATGKRAFREETSPRLTDAILHETPLNPRLVNTRVSSELDHIILKCLEKELERRYQSAKEIGVDLRRLGTASGAVQPAAAVSPGMKSRAAGLLIAIAAAALLALLVGLNVGGLRERLFGGGGPGRIESLAVLPLENLSGDPKQDYFVDGMTEALITNLSKIGALKVISRTSAMRYKDSDKSLPQIARELGVHAVIEGSVLQVGNRVRITAQLIEAATDEHLWAESYERELSDVLRLQGEVSQAIAREIRIQLTPEEETRLSQTRSVNADVYRLYLQGRYHLRPGSQGSIQNAIKKFEEAIEVDPSYAPAYAGLADAYNVLGYIGFGDFPASRERLTRAKTLALKALELDDSLAEAHTSLGAVKQRLDLDIAGAEREHLRALSLNPGSASAREVYSFLLSALGRHDESLAMAREAQRLDPLSPQANLSVGAALQFARRYDEAIQEIEKTREMFPNQEIVGYWRGYWLGLSLIGKGRYLEAIEEFERTLQYSGGSQIGEAALGYAYGLAGQRENAEATLARFKELHRQRQISPYYVAWIYAGLGWKAEALDWLERAYEERWGHLVYLKVNPAWDGLRSDPRYLNLVRKIGLEN